VRLDPQRLLPGPSVHVGVMIGPQKTSSGLYGGAMYHAFSISRSATPSPLSSSPSFSPAGDSGCSVTSAVRESLYGIVTSPWS
jgi:hypothetical protein